MPFEKRKRDEENIMRTAFLKRMTAVIGFIFLASFLFLSVSALDTPALPELPQSDGYELTIDYGIGLDDGTRKGIDGADFVLYKVADLSEINGQIRYIPCPPFESVIPDNLDTVQTASGMLEAEISRALADRSIKTAEETGMEGIEAVTDETGCASLHLEDAGLYLMTQKEGTGSALLYQEIDPYLLAGPRIQNNQWQTSIPIMLKTLSSAGMKNKSADTGVDNGRTIWLIMLVSSASACVFAAVWAIRHWDSNSTS